MLKHASEANASSKGPVRDPRINRRRFLRAMGGLAAGGAGLLGYTRFIEPFWVEVVERPLPIAHLPSAMQGARLVQVSDLHVGPVVDADYMTEALKQVASLGPDMLVITGDFMTCHGDEQVDTTVRMMVHLPTPRFGTFAVLGNHDYAHGWSRADVADRLARGLETQGIRVLRNEIAQVEGLQLAGLDDLWGPNFDPEPALRTLVPNRAALVLCHNPDAADRPVWHGYRGWILAGHTHGGQCAAPLWGPPILPVRNRRYTSGEIDLFDGRRLYINPGLGYLRPVRFAVRPQITLFTLEKA